VDDGHDVLNEFLFDAVNAVVANDDSDVVTTEEPV
jgi:hypothetical protein